MPNKQKRQQELGQQQEIEGSSSRNLLHLSARPSSPCVDVSPSVPSIGWSPVSTLMPGIIPCLFKTSTNGSPEREDWKSVSSNMIAPLIYCNRKVNHQTFLSITFHGIYLFFKKKSYRKICFFFLFQTSNMFNLTMVH